MEVNIDKKIIPIKFGNLAAGSFFWYNDYLYLKPKFSTACDKNFTHMGLAIFFEADRINIFDTRTDVILDTGKFEIKYKETE